MDNESDNLPVSNPKNNTGKSRDKMFGLSKNTIIIFLMVLVILALLGFNIFLGVGIILDRLFSGIKNIFTKLLTMLGFYTGAVINTTADVVGDTAKETIDIAEGSLQSVGNLLQNRNNIGNRSIEQEQWNLNFFGLNPSPKENEFSDNDDNDNENMNKITELTKRLEETNNELATERKMNIKKELDTTINNKPELQKKVPSNYNKNDTEIKWCPIGLDSSGGQCMPIGKNDKCVFGKVFDNEATCKMSQTIELKKTNFNNFSQNWGMKPPVPPPAALVPPTKHPLLYGSLTGTRPSCVPKNPCHPSTQNINGLIQPPYKQYPVQYPPMNIQSPPPMMSNDVVDRQNNNNGFGNNNRNNNNNNNNNRNNNNNNNNNNSNNNSNNSNNNNNNGFGNTDNLMNSVNSSPPPSLSPPPSISPSTSPSPSVNVNTDKLHDDSHTHHFLTHSHKEPDTNLFSFSPGFDLLSDTNRNNSTASETGVEEVYAPDVDITYSESSNDSILRPTGVAELGEGVVEEVDAVAELGEEVDAVAELGEEVVEEVDAIAELGEEVEEVVPAPPTAEITKSNCLDRAKSEYGDKVTAKRSKLISNGKGWNHLPQGCSVQSGGDWAAHWNVKDGKNDGRYAKVGDTGTTITKSNCLDRAKAEYGDKVTSKRSKLISNGKGWNHLPQGCSVQSGGDWAAHWNVKDGKNNDKYTKVGDIAGAATEPVVPVPPTEAGCYVLNKDGCPKQAKHNKPGEWIKTNAWNDANKSDEKCENRIKSFNWECGVKTFQHHFNPK